MQEHIVSELMSSFESSDRQLGIVVIGRNEGERLRICFDSVLSERHPVVYVDSGSTDGSPEAARSRGVDVISLDMNIPFTAARARNAGFYRLNSLVSNLRFVQFVDGDCEVMPGWLDSARSLLATNDAVAATCGRLRERHPEQSVYNLLCDMEWQAPPGESRSTGGNAMFRADVFAAVGGYREELIAGEEPELCVRLRQAGWRIWRLPDEMALHDAAMTSFVQWWRRTARGGHAAAEGATLHRTSTERESSARVWRALTWGALLPIFGVLMSLSNPMWLLVLLAYPIQMLRLSVRGGIWNRSSRVRAFFLVLGRFPEAVGVATFWLNRWRHRRSALIEYK